MTVINDGAATATFDDVVRLEVAERVLGGADASPANRHGLALARRTRYLLNRVNGTVQKAVWTTTVITATNAAAYTVPATGVVSALLTGVAPGGGAAYGNAYGAAPGGGEGARIQDYPVTLVPGAVMAATIGAVGVGGTAGTTSGTAGGDSIFAGVTLTGGDGGTFDTAQGGLGGTVTLDGLTHRAAPGLPSSEFHNDIGTSVAIGGTGGGMGGGRGGSAGAAGEAGVNGGGGGGGGAAANGGNGGPSYFILKVLTLVPQYTA